VCLCERGCVRVSVQVSKWLASSSSDERVYALQILLAVVNADPKLIDKLVVASGAVRSILGSLKKAIKGGEDELFLASEVLRVLTHNQRFVASMFVKDVAGLPIILTAITSGTGACVSSVLVPGAVSPPRCTCAPACTHVCTRTPRERLPEASHTHTLTFTHAHAPACVTSIHRVPRLCPPSPLPPLPPTHLLWAHNAEGGGGGGGGAKSKTPVFDSTSAHNCSITADGSTATSTSSDGWARSTVGFSKGVHRWWVLLDKDSHGDEGSTLGVCTATPSSSYSGSGWFTMRAYNGALRCAVCVAGAVGGVLACAGARMSVWRGQVPMCRRRLLHADVGACMVGRGTAGRGAGLGWWCNPLGPDPCVSP
jgi:hypothetical protein